MRTGPGALTRRDTGGNLTESDYDALQRGLILLTDVMFDTFTTILKGGVGRRHQDARVADRQTRSTGAVRQVGGSRPARTVTAAVDAVPAVMAASSESAAGGNDVTCGAPVPVRTWAVGQRDHCREIMESATDSRWRPVQRDLGAT